MRRQIPESYKNRNTGQALGYLCAMGYVAFIIVAWVVKLVSG